MFDLSNLQPAPGSQKKRKRVGRGPGSGNGKTCGRGTKGQKSRSGGRIPLGFEGGQMPLARRLPKRGFTNNFRKKVAIINIDQLDRFEANSVVDEDSLRSVGLVSGRFDAIKLLANGDINKALTIKIDRASTAACQKIEQAGGKVEVLGGK